MGLILPSEYQQVEYLEKALSEANNTHINTGIIASSEIDFDFSGQALGNNETVTFFGGRQAYQNKALEGIYTLHHATIATGMQFRYGDKAGPTGVFAESPAINIHEVKHYKKEGQTFICNNSIATTAKQVFSSSPIGLFSCIQGSEATTNTGGARIFYFKLYESGELVRSFIPCYRKSDSKPGMYDLVTKQFFVNQGTGDDFLVGPDVIDSISPLMVAWRRIMMAAASVAKKLTKLIATSTTGLVSFDTNVQMPVKVTCEFSPIQDLSHGNPSPENECPISGWTGASIVGSNRNLVKTSGFEKYGSGQQELTYDQANNAIISVVGANYVGIAQAVNVKPNTDYVFSAAIDNAEQTCSLTVMASNNSTVIKASGDITVAGTHSVSFNSGNNSLIYLRVYTCRNYRLQKNRTVTVSGIILCEGTTTDGVQQTILPINWQSEADTVYGGTVTLNEDGSADLVADRWKHVEDGSYIDKFPWRTGAAENILESLGKRLPKPQDDYAFLDNASKFIGDSRTFKNNVNAGLKANEFTCYRATGYSFIIAFDSTVVGTTKSELQAYLAEHPITFVYPLLHPATYHFDNIGQLNSFLGQNNIWHNINGDIAVEYWKNQ